MAIQSITRSITFGQGQVENEQSRVEQHSLWRSALLHLLPGILIVTLFVATVPLATGAGFPPLFAMLIAGIGGGLGFQIGHLLYEGRRRNSKWSLEGIVLYREPMSLWQYFVLVPLLVIVAFVVNALTAPVSAYFLSLVPWLPEWFELRNPALMAAYPKPVLAITFGVYLLLNGIVAPIVEELYFRGYLLPRLSRFGRWAPAIELALFTLYHFWQPYYWVTQFLGLLPVVYAVWWKRNIKLGISVHMLLNVIGGLAFAALLLG